MKLIVEDEVFAPGSRIHKLAMIMGWRFHHALGVACSLWHSSQAAEVSQASSDEVLTFCGPLSKSERTRLLDALTTCAIISGTEDGQHRIHGNEHHVSAKKHSSTVQRNRALARWAKVKQTTELGDADGIPTAYQRHAVGMPQAYASAVQSSAVQCSAVQSGERERDPALALAEQAHRDVETRPQLAPLSDKLSDLRAEAVSTADADKVWAAYQDAREQVREIPRALQHNGTDMRHCKAVLALAAGSVPVACKVVRAFVSSDGPKRFWSERKWPLWLIAEEKNFELARTLAAEDLRGITGRGQGGVLTTEVRGNHG